MDVWPLSKQQFIIYTAILKAVAHLRPERDDDDDDSVSSSDSWSESISHLEDSTVRLFIDSVGDLTHDELFGSILCTARRLRELFGETPEYVDREIPPEPPLRSFDDLFCKRPPLFLGISEHNWSRGFTFRPRTTRERQTRKQPLTRTEWLDIRSVELECTAPRCSGNKDHRQHRRKHPRPFNIQQRTPQKQLEWIIPHMRAF
jgi:hypothetical protein